MVDKEPPDRPPIHKRKAVISGLVSLVIVIGAICGYSFGEAMIRHISTAVGALTLIFGPVVTRWLRSIGPEVIALALLPTMAIAATAQSTQPAPGSDPAPLYDATLYQDKPSDPLPGMRPITVIYEWGGFYEKDDAGAERMESGELPRRERVNQMAQKHAGELVIANLENLSIDKVVTVARWMHDAAPGLRVGAYPYGGRSTGNGFPANAERWIEEGNQQAPVMREVDVSIVGAYSGWASDFEDWQERTAVSIDFAERWHKPVYVFISPYAQRDTEHYDRGQPLQWFDDATRWLRKRNDVAGVIVWSGSKPWLADRPPHWWGE